MQVHEKVEDLVYDFVEFLENNSLYSRMTLEEEGWKVISAEHERIERERRDIAGARKTVASRWGQKLLDIWTPEQGSSLYSVKMNAMSKMHWKDSKRILGESDDEASNLPSSSSSFY